MNYRPLRVSKLIREELSVLVGRELEFDGALPTITEVEVDKKLDTAKVLVSVFPTSKTDAVFKVLNAARFSLQHALKKKINIKPMPKVVFIPDFGPANAAEVEKAFKKQRKMQ